MPGIFLEAVVIVVYMKTGVEIDRKGQTQNSAFQQN